MKKPVLILLTGMALILLHTAVYAQRVEAFERKAPAFENPKDIIITQPLGDMETSESEISIMGACDYEYPIYMNGEQLRVTEHGFFVRYVSLKDGENTFVFSNNGKERTLVITKTETPVVRKHYDTPMYGVINREYVTHRALPDEDVNLLTPLAKGTCFKVLGEAGDYYHIEGGTYIYKEAIDIHEGELPPNTVTGVKIAEDGNVTYINYAMNAGALYDISMSEAKAKVTLYATDESESANTKGGRVINAVKAAFDEKSVWDFEFCEAPIGYFARIKEGEMTIGFRFAQKPAGGSLSGKSIVIDAGHGGGDTGALGPLGVSGPVEKDFNLYVALAAAEYLAGKGAEVHLTRGSDEFVGLSDRVSEILTRLPDISVSIHANSMPITADYGNFKGPLMFYTFDTSESAATYVHEYLTKYFGMEYLPPRKENFALTRITNCPAILFEMSFMSNPDDYEWLLNAESLEYMGLAVGKGIEGYLLDAANIADTNNITATDSELKAYIVRPGDTLCKIARLYGIDWRELQSLNGIQNPRLIYPGQRIILPTQKAA